MQLRATTLLLLTCLFAGGCAHYEYDIVEPADLAQHVGQDRDVVFKMPPLEYHLRSFDDHLVLRIYNQSGDPLRLMGEQSYAVDPHGQSHPLRGQSIAPDSFVKVILPPIPPQVEPEGPRIGIGIGVGSAYGPYRRRYYDPYWDDRFYDRPRYYAIYDGDYIWGWDGETDVRLSLVFVAESKPPFRQNFLFHRRKM